MHILKMKGCGSDAVRIRKNGRLVGADLRCRRFALSGASARRFGVCRGVAYRRCGCGSIYQIRLVFLMKIYCFRSPKLLKPLFRIFVR